MLNEDPNEVHSPCVSICALDENDICVGCYRSGDEIGLWSGMGKDEKLAIIDKAKVREQQI